MTHALDYALEDLQRKHPKLNGVIGPWSAILLRRVRGPIVRISFPLYAGCAFVPDERGSAPRSSRISAM